MAWKSPLYKKLLVTGVAVGALSYSHRTTEFRPFLEDKYSDVKKYVNSLSDLLKKYASSYHGNYLSYHGIYPGYQANCREKEPSDRHNFDFIADAAEIALPSVVSIDIVAHNNIFVRQESSGSGFIVDKRGYIITNEHVIRSFKDVIVTFQDETKLKGRVVAIDPRTDLALIKVESNKELPEIKMGDDSALRPGQWVCAIGNSLSLPNTVTVGVVSNVSRDIKNKVGMLDYKRKMGSSNYIQTDAAINDGNSGGPLINLNGEVIAVNTLGLVGRVNAISFSIPISEVKRFLSQFSAGDLRDPAHSKYSLGVKTITLTPDMVHFLRTNNKLAADIEGGVFVYQTVRGSPAHQIGLKKGDVIVAINDKVVTSYYDITVVLKQVPDKEVSIVFYRPDVGLINTLITPVPSIR